MKIQEILSLYVEKLKNIYGELLLQVSLFGSYARGDNTKDSDIDILVVVKGSQGKKSHYNSALCEMSANFNIDYDVDIKVIDISSDYFYKWHTVDPFLLNVARDEVRLYGVA